jgi:hypothetical protein
MAVNVGLLKPRHLHLPLIRRITPLLSTYLNAVVNAGFSLPRIAELRQRGLITGTCRWCQFVALRITLGRDHV